MKLAICSREYPPVTDYAGGIGSQYGRLAPALAALGHEVHVLTYAPRSGPVGSPIAGVHVHQIVPARAWPWHVWLHAGAVARTLRAHGPFDAILAAEFAGEASRYARRQDAGPLATHLLTSSAQLVSLRPGLTRRERGGVATRTVHRLERSQAAQSVELSAPSDRVLEWARELWPEIGGIPTRRVPLTLEVDDVVAGEPPSAFPHGARTIVLPSRLDGHKGGQLLIESLRSLPDDVQLVFVGREGTWDGRPISEYLGELAGPQRDRVHFLGTQPWPAYLGVVAAATIVAIPSYWESFCLAAVEALALQRPLVATLGHGFDAFARDGENALMIEKGDVPALTAALTRLLADDGLRERLGVAGRATAESLDTRRVAPLYVDWLTGVASRGST